MIDGLEDGTAEASKEERWVVIHRDGDLNHRRRPSSPSPSSNSSSSSEEDEDEAWDFDPSTILHMIPLPHSIQPDVPFDLGRRLDLGVGGEGIIGRRVSFVTGGRVVGEGVMGWN
ncbi:unnamed protein product [Zymoseptoria tritici ST99CH_1A5]|nr:unnamed protein product [Zymoseptoria tritici ST99CH_1E4]SMR54748.1 unnamed protein product [Zymoseptoria tritici ST99CH_3D1]SMY24857.1 unnamed protein product [Zymoseptoria tritici ST99CH_1A5]